MKKYSPLIHIGYHKTATSWFQKNFYPYVSDTTYVNRKLVRDVFLNTIAFTFDPEHAREKLRTENRPILCEEDLCGHPDNGGLLESLSKDMAYRLHAVYPDAQIIVFIRNQLDMIRSTYLQYIRGGGTYSLRRYLYPYDRGNIYKKRWYKKPRLTLDHFSYQHLIRHYQSIFGSENVHVFCYEEFAENSRAFTEKFADRFGLKAPLEQLKYTRRNESLGIISLQLARILGPFSRWDTPNRLILLPVIPMWMHKAGLKAFNKTYLGGPQVTNQRLFGDRLYSKLHNHFVADNLSLIQDINLPLENYNYPLSQYDLK